MQAVGDDDSANATNATAANNRLSSSCAYGFRYHATHTSEQLETASLFWQYDLSTETNSRRLRTWLHGTPHTFEHVIKAATVMTSKGAMSAMEEEHLLSGTERDNKKVRVDAGMSVSPAIIRQVLSESGKLLPSSLALHWYRPE